MHVVIGFWAGSGPPEQESLEPSKHQDGCADEADEMLTWLYGDIEATCRQRPVPADNAVFPTMPEKSVFLKMPNLPICNCGKQPHGPQIEQIIYETREHKNWICRILDTTSISSQLFLQNKARCG